MSVESRGHKELSRRSFLKGMGAFGLAAASAAVLAACSGGASSSSANAGGSSANANTASGTSNAAGTVSGKILVAYFSGSGHTRRVAEQLAGDLSADIFEIVPANPYSDDDLDFTNDDSRVVREHEDESLQDVELSQNAPDDFADYDTVLVGYPIWWMDAAWAMHHFASANDFSGKTVIPFCTSYSSGIGRSGSTLEDLAGTGDWHDGQRFDQDCDLSEVDSWAQGLTA